MIAPDLYTGVPPTTVPVVSPRALLADRADVLVPGAAVYPGVAQVPKAQSFGSYRVVLSSSSLVQPAAAGAMQVVTGNVWATWDYREGVNPAAEAVPLLAQGTRFWIDQTIHTLTAPVWPSGPGDGPVCWMFEPALSYALDVGAIVWLLVKRSSGASRCLRSSDLTAERLNALLIAFGNAINVLAEDLWVTWEGAPAQESATLRAGAVQVGHAYIRPWADENGDYLPVMTEQAAAATAAGLVLKSASVAAPTWSHADTGTLWPTLASLQSAWGAAGWLEMQS